MVSAVLQLIGRSIAVGLRMASVWPYLAMAKRRGKRQFIKELQQLGLDRNTVAILSKAYMDMVSINPGHYIRAVRRS